MNKALLSFAAVVLGSLAFAQPYINTPEYAPTAIQGGTVNEFLFGDITTLNPVTSSTAQEVAVIGLYSGPSIVFRDWVGTRAFKNPDGTFNLSWATEIIEEVPDRQFLITVAEGWMWSDGTEMTVDDIIAGQTLLADPEVEANGFSCAVLDDEPVVLEKVDTYQYRATLPKAIVNAILNANCLTIPAHVFMPVYEAQGAAGIKAMWGVDTNPATIVSGGPYRLVEFRAGERVVLEKNPVYSEFNFAADMSPLPGPDRWVVNLVTDQNQQLAAAITGQASFYWPTNLDQVRAVQEAVSAGTIAGQFFPNIGPDKLVDFVTYNFNNTDQCKRDMFRAVEFRQAISIMIDRSGLVEAAVGGLGFPAVDYRSQALAPFLSNNEPFEVNPQEGLRLLASLGFTEEGPDGVLRNPTTGCRVEFDLQFNSGNNRRSQLALVIAQQLDPYGIQVNPREVDSGTWGDSITGTTLPRPVNYDANIWGLAGGDIDNPAFSNGLRLGANLNAWNKSRTDVEPWEILLERIDVRMEEELDLNRRIALWQEQADLLREYLPMTPLISPAYHLYVNLGNVWPPEVIGTVSSESPYRPGNFRSLLTAP